MLFTPGNSASSIAFDFLFVFGVVRFHPALFASEPETVNKISRVLKVLHSLVYSFNHTRTNLEADRDHLFSWVSVQLFGPHLTAIAVFTPAQKIRTNGEANLS